MMSEPVRIGVLDTSASAVSVTDLWLCAVIGVAVTALLFVITEFYTSTRFRPVKSIAKASETGHATNIIQGLAQGYQSTAAPALVLALAILGANELAGVYGIGIAVMAQLSLCGLIVALDAFGPITDNAGGIAEMADLPEVGPQRHRPARRGRQHDQGGHQGLRDRLRGARGAGAVRRLQERAGRGGAGRVRPQQPLQPDRPRRADRSDHRRDDGLSVRGVRDRGRRPRRRRGRRTGPRAVPRAPGNHGGHRKARLRENGRASSPWRRRKR